MATHVSCQIRFSDGSFTFLRDDVSEDTLTELQTDASGILNLTGDISVGTANQDKVATHAICKVQTDSAQTGSFGYAAFYSPQGNVVCPIQGGGFATGGLNQLIKPVRMQTGVQVKVYWQGVADAVQQASLAVYCASGKCDIFSATAVDDTNVSMVNKDGSTWGEALSGETVLGGYATYSATNGLADTGVADGIDAFFVESSAGQLLGMYGPNKGSSSHIAVPYNMQTIRVNQNDTLTVRANV
jgi:hypothetical protein